MRWIKHLSLAHADEAISFVLEEHGAEAYGAWWLILEDIAAPMESGKMEPIASHSVVKWAQICHCSARRFRSIANSLAQKNLIVVESDLDRIRIEVPNILKYKDEYSKRSGETPEQDREHIQKESRKKADTETPADLRLQKPDEVAAWYEGEFYPEFPLHKAKWEGLKAARIQLKTPELRALAINSLRNQRDELLSREPSKRPYPATWINQKRWEDEPGIPAKVEDPILALAKKQIERNGGRLF